jgi:hypothetical protein
VVVPSLSCADPFLVQARLVDMARRLPENQFRRLHLNQWTTGRDVAFPESVWADAESEMEVPDGTEIIASFVAARQHDAVALVGCTLESPHLFPLKIWESSTRVDPHDVADELRSIWGRFSVREFLVSEADWQWVLLQLAEEACQSRRFRDHLSASRCSDRRSSTP